MGCIGVLMCEGPIKLGACWLSNGAMLSRGISHNISAQSRGLSGTTLDWLRNVILPYHAKSNFSVTREKLHMD